MKEGEMSASCPSSKQHKDGAQGPETLTVMEWERCQFFSSAFWRDDSSLAFVKRSRYGDCFMLLPKREIPAELQQEFFPGSASLFKWYRKHWLYNWRAPDFRPPSTISCVTQSNYWMYSQLGFCQKHGELMVPFQNGCRHDGVSWMWNVFLCPVFWM